MCAILVLNRLAMVTWMSQKCTSLGIDESQINHRLEKKHHNFNEVIYKIVIGWLLSFQDSS